MKSITKIKHLLWDNDISLKISETGKMEMILTNKVNQTSSYCEGNSWTTLLKTALKDSIKMEQLKNTDHEKQSIPEPAG